MDENHPYVRQQREGESAWHDVRRMVDGQV